MTSNCYINTLYIFFLGRVCWFPGCLYEVVHCKHLNRQCYYWYLAAAIYTPTTSVTATGTSGSFNTIVAAVSSVGGGVFLLLVTVTIILIVAMSVIGRKKKPRWVVKMFVVVWPFNQSDFFYSRYERYMYICITSRKFLTFQFPDHFTGPAIKGSVMTLVTIAKYTYNYWEIWGHYAQLDCYRYDHTCMEDLKSLHEVELALVMD